MKTILTIALLALAACDNSPINRPVPGTKCFYQEIACVGGGCCPRGTECGGAWPNCPKDLCCATGEDDGRMFGKKRFGDGGAP